jgi:isopentenyl diphosphate isomerase/L-lactate dehydrogenase-like FMN-dependent dehydrogenase
VHDVLQLLNDEFLMAMKLCGCIRVSDLKPAMVRTAMSFQAKL